MLQFLQTVGRERTKDGQVQHPIAQMAKSAGSRCELEFNSIEAQSHTLLIVYLEPADYLGIQRVGKWR